MNVITVQNGTFAEVKSELIKDTQSVQFKMPRVMRKKDILMLLMEGSI